VLLLRSSLSAVGRNRLFAAALAAGLCLRVLTIAGFPPAIWFAGDSISYVTSALAHSPGVSRVSGYSLLLMALRPLHSFAVVTGVQHLMGLAMGVLIYALLRRRGLPRWGATLSTLPVLLDAYQVQLEQEMLPDIMFAFLATGAVTLCVWWPDHERPAWASAVAAAALGLAAVCWPVGMPLLILLVLVMIARRAGWRALTATVVAGALPLVLYLAWYDREHHRVAFNSSSGVFLWARTMTFADCAIIKPPADERPLCPHKPVSKRQAASLWIWQKHTPLANMPQKFSARTNGLAGNFARRAILAQPLGYAKAVLDGFALTFEWNRPQRPNKGMSERYSFTLATHDWDHTGTPRARAIVRVQHAYTGGHLAFTRAVRPMSTIMINYQRFIYLRGTMVGVLLLLGLAAVGRALRGGGYRRRREWGGPALFPFLTGLAVLLVPVMTADFSLRYVVPAVPAISLAAAFLFLRSAPHPVSSPVPPAHPTPVDRAEDQRTTPGPLPA
jgi:Dolichyl-phosphate-mannose-protein mannosyltransferase